MAAQEILELPLGFLPRDAAQFLDLAGDPVAPAGGHRLRVVGEPAPADLQLSADPLADALQSVPIHIWDCCTALTSYPYGAVHTARCLTTRLMGDRKQFARRHPAQGVRAAA